MNKTFNLNFHKSHVIAIFSALKDIFLHNNYADKALEKVMRANKKWGVKDRSFVAESVYDIVRRWRFLCTVIDQEPSLTDKNLWSILGAWLIIRGDILPESGNFSDINPQKIADKAQKLSKIRKIRESVPDWLDKLGEQELENRWDSLLDSMNNRPKIYLRVNTLKTNIRELQTQLASENIETSLVSWAPNALELKFTRNVFRAAPFKEGFFEVQDAASQMVADFMDVKPGMKVVDACAGAGGKSLHLGSIMQNKGRIIALDTEEWKLKELRTRASRAGVQNIEVRVIDTTKVVKRLYDTADRLLLDVPCSGLGVLRRNPDAKWRLQPEEIDRVKLIQADLLERYSNIVKVNGQMVYATCSVLPSEGEGQIDKFMEKHSEKWKVVGEKRYWPDVDNCDGFYMARLERIK
jgi:16S rRNA (cytosine967-C5)-methyltransferase